VLANRANPPDAILREVYLRTGDKPFARIEDVISAEGGWCPSPTATRGRGVEEMSVWRKWCLTPFILCVAIAAGAQEPYPKRPVKMMVPFTPGTGMDILARARRAARGALEQPVVVENRPGASSNIGTDAVAKAPLGPHARHREHHRAQPRSLQEHPVRSRQGARAAAGAREMAWSCTRR
jgi:hypothetical protein